MPQPKNIIQYRKWVTGLNNYRIATGFASSQRVPYDVPHWHRTAAVLLGCDKPSQDIYTLRLKLAGFGFVLSEKSIHDSLKIMMNVKAGVHPHVRKCGQDCKTVVEAFGGVKVWKNPATGVDEYFFGKTQKEINNKKSTIDVCIPV